MPHTDAHMKVLELFTRSIDGVVLSSLGQLPPFSRLLPFDPHWVHVIGAPLVSASQAERWPIAIRALHIDSLNL